MDVSDLPCLYLPDLFLLTSGAGLGLGVLSIVILLFLSGLISGSEVAFFSLTANDYEELESKESAANRLILSFRDQPRNLLATILIANNFINIAIVLISTLLLESLFPEGIFVGWLETLQENFEWVSIIPAEIAATFIRFSITVIGVTFLLVLFGEVAPKVYARYNKLRLATLMARPVKTMMSLFKPLSFALVSGASIVERRLENHSIDSAAASQEEIDEAIELTVNNEDNGEEGPRQDVDILKRIVQFANVTVRQVMRSRGDVIAADLKIDYHELLALIREHGYSRIPVFEEDFDKVKGILYVKDLLGYRHEGPEFNWSVLVRPEVLYVPENKKVSDLLKEFQQEKMHLAIVVDEYGGTEGIVTLEDVLEEVIGDIHDEFDEGDEIIFEKIDDFNFIFDGKTLLNDVCRVLELPTNTFDEVKGDAESLAGLLLEMLGQFPEEEQEMSYEEYRFRVMSLTKRRIEEILVTLPADEE
ncbi:gliding motility-associated protein GldE [Neolewinella aurantiaca]|uniref:Gliding motility-associated protein GldE n=1 Tax=Neolewinella aurantiaca TaxID=2602767 RepID=A0A5C7FQF4_9BACT|nr:gliding motility-associated protein GldE [Neolewinella aurantiaca]TXF88256.1 gliding motility-associated protein GldE [Neolewinella aurantiaca]